jgi:aspartate racemase
MHTPSFAEYVRFLDSGDLGGIANLMLASARKLAKAGADFLICPDNTIHEAFDLVEPRSPLPWIHIAEVVADEAGQRGFRHLGLTGTAWLVRSEVYPKALGARGLQCTRPADSDRDEVSRIIMEELVHGRFEPRSIGFLGSVVRRLADRGCEAVILGCTELPLVMDERSLPLPTLDSTRLLARAALRRAVGPRR